MEVRIIFKDATAEKVFKKADNVYTKGGLLVVREGDWLFKYPLTEIFSVVHKHGNHWGSNSHRAEKDWSDFMTNGDKFREKLAKKSNAGLAEFLVNMSINNVCKYCIYIEKTCSSKCEYGIKTWLDTPCEESPPADETQEAIQTEVRVDLRKVAKEIVSECKEHYPNDCEDCRYGDSIGLCCFKQEPPTWDLGTANEATPPDMVNKPVHYVKGGMECIDFIKVIVSDLTPYEAYCLGNVVKYLWRFKDKNGVVDLDKAVRYIEFLKEAQGNDLR